MKKKEHLIYQSSYFDENLTDNEIEEGENFDDKMWFDDEKTNLNVELDEDIIAIAEMGLWNGKRMGYKIMGSNLKNILSAFSSCDYIKFNSSGRDIVGMGIHHDGTNTCVFRKWKKGLSDSAKEKTINAIYQNDSNVQELIKKNTRSIYKDVQKIYGW